MHDKVSTVDALQTNVEFSTIQRKKGTRKSKLDEERDVMRQSYTACELNTTRVTPTNELHNSKSKKQKINQRITRELKEKVRLNENEQDP